MVQGHRRRGAITLVVGLVWALGFLLVVQPHLGDGVSQLQAYAAFGDTPGLDPVGDAHPPGRPVHPGLLPAELRAARLPVRARCSSCRSCRRATCCRSCRCRCSTWPATSRMATRYGPQSVAIIAFIFLATPRGLNRLGRAQRREGQHRPPRADHHGRGRAVVLRALRAQLDLRAAVGLGRPGRGRRRPHRGGRLAAERLPGAGLGVDAGAAGRAGRALPPRPRPPRRARRPTSRTSPEASTPSSSTAARSPAANAYRERILEVQITQHGFTVQSDAEDIVVFTRPPDQS